MFNVGDIVTGNERNRYVFTSKLATMEVVGIGTDGYIDVRIIDTSDKRYRSKRGQTYQVEACNFKFVSQPNPENI